MNVPKLLEQEPEFAALVNDILTEIIKLDSNSTLVISIYSMWQAGLDRETILQVFKHQLKLMG